MPARKLPQHVAPVRGSRLRLVRRAGCSEACVAARSLAVGMDRYVDTILHDPDTHEEYGRLSVATPDRRIVVGTLEIDLSLRTVYNEGQPLLLTKTEWRILEAFVSRPDTLLTSIEWTRIIWDVYQAQDRGHILRSTLPRLRKKLGANARYIQTYPARGYIFCTKGLLDGEVPTPEGAPDVLHPATPPDR